MVAVAAPALLGWVGGLVLLLRGDEHHVHLHAPLWVTVVTAGLVLAGVAATVTGLQRMRARHRRATRAALQRARRQWDVETRARNVTFLARLDTELAEPARAISASLPALGPVMLSNAGTAISSQAARITSMVDGLGLLTDLERRDLDLVQVELEPVIKQVVSTIRSRLSMSGTGQHDILVLSPSQPVVVAGVQDLLRDALYHLVINAVKFSDPGATITISCVEDGEGAVVEVADMGRGIPEVETSDVWEPLVRASNADDSPGSGIGLPLVRTIVERHGGRADLSSHLGEGTSVVLRLPTLRR